MPNLDGEDYHSFDSAPSFARGGDTYEDRDRSETRDVDELLTNEVNDLQICLAALPIQTNVAEEGVSL